MRMLNIETKVSPKQSMKEAQREQGLFMVHLLLPS